MTGKGFGSRVLQARLNLAAALGRTVTQAEIGRALGVSGVTVGRWEAGTKEPSLATIARLASVLGVDPGYLAFGDEVQSDEGMQTQVEPRATKPGRQAG